MSIPLGHILEMRELRRRDATIREIKQIYPEYGLGTIWKAVKGIPAKRRPHPNRRADPAEVIRLLASNSLRGTAKLAGISPSRVVAIRQEQTMQKPNPAEAKIDLILECFAEGFTLEQTASRLEWEKVKVTPEQVAAALRKYRDLLSAQTEARFATGF